MSCLSNLAALQIVMSSADIQYDYDGTIKVQAGQAPEPEPHQQHRRAEGKALHGDRQEEQASQPEPGRSSILLILQMCTR